MTWENLGPGGASAFTGKDVVFVPVWVAEMYPWVVDMPGVELVDFGPYDVDDLELEPPRLGDVYYREPVCLDCQGTGTWRCTRCRPAHTELCHCSELDWELS